MNPTFEEPEEHVGCAATSLPFDCLDGLSKFKKWSAEKRQWLLGVASGYGVQPAKSSLRMPQYGGPSFHSRLHEVLLSQRPCVPLRAIRTIRERISLFVKVGSPAI